MKKINEVFVGLKNLRCRFVCALLAIGLIILAASELTTSGSAQSIMPDGGGTFYTVSGNVKADGANLSDATVVLLLDSNVVESAITDANGNYSLNALENFSYTVSVYKEGYNFNPSYQLLNNVQSDLTVNFQNGVRLCVPPLAGQTGGIYCQDATTTSASVIQNGKIAFEIFGSTFAVDADGTNQMQLPPAGAYPSWSFDGTKLLYNRTTSLDPDQEIYITNADGTGSRQITFNFVNDYKAKWSPDGTRAVFNRVFNSSDIEIFSINTDSPNNGINEVQLTNDNCINQDPTYSPDGTKIAFAKICEAAAASGIYTINANDGSTPTQLTSGFTDLSPSWKPDGSRIVFNRDGDLWRVNANGNGVIQITFDPNISYYSPVYSPDGTKIAFSRVPSEIEFQEIYTLNPESGEQIRLTNNQQQFQNKEYPSWQRIVASVPVTLFGGVNLTFSNVTSSGNTVATPISLASAGALPAGYGTFSESVAFDVRTSANYSGNIEICFNVPNVNDQNLFENLVVFHNENGTLIDRTSSRDFAARRICAVVASLSPFVVAAPVAPTTAYVTVSGRVISRGRGLSNAIVSATDADGNTRTANSDFFGYFQFEAVEAGQTYVFTVRAKLYNFAPRVVTVVEDTEELNFIGER